MDSVERDYTGICGVDAFIAAARFNALGDMQLVQSVNKMADLLVAAKTDDTSMALLAGFACAVVNEAIEDGNSFVCSVLDGSVLYTEIHENGRKLFGITYRDKQ